MARKRVPIFPIFEEVRRTTALLSDEEFGQAVRYALNCYYGGQEQAEADKLVKLAAAGLLEQAARYDSFRELQRKNALNPEGEGEPSAAIDSQVQPIQTENSENGPSDPPSPIPSPLNNMCDSAIRLLNNLSGSSFRASTKNTQRLVAARAKDGYTMEDIETVIRHQCGLWAKDEKMQRYLRPETLFGNKFESYLSDARRHEPKQEQGYVLAPVEDPYETAVREGSNA